MDSLNKDIRSLQKIMSGDHYFHHIECWFTVSPLFIAHSFGINYLDNFKLFYS